MQHPDISQLLVANSHWSERIRRYCPDFFLKSAGTPQAPKILWIGCADSRVPESVITDSAPGDIFVHRNIANQLLENDDNAHSALAFAVSENIGVQHVVVVGHSICGAAQHAVQCAALGQDPPTVTALDRWLAPLTRLAGELDLPPDNDKAVEILVEENVRVQVENVHKALGGSPVWVHGLVYDLRDGCLRDLGITKEPFPR
ncbi:carbonic anhydrase [Leucogyrophana mollusca]|uniref:Carbonic anhydrase n=1 Tax=Leucogyrophana mollusca TaxID=85980 RepID=A0ACB8BEM4_9AGAM|nr:carbonic anhydrase [Leucogyrophana mollusca]